MTGIPDFNYPADGAAIWRVMHSCVASMRRSREDNAVVGTYGATYTCPECGQQLSYTVKGGRS